MLLYVCEFPQQRRSVPSPLTGFGVPVAVRVPAALSPYCGWEEGTMLPCRVL